MTNKRQNKGVSEETTSLNKSVNWKRIREVRAIKDNLRIIELAKNQDWNHCNVRDLRKILELKHIVWHRSASKKELIAMVKKYNN